MSDKGVLFATGLGKTIDRAENIKCLYEAYPGKKTFVQCGDINYWMAIESGEYGLIVLDVFPQNHPLPTLMIWHAIQGGKYIGLDEGKYYTREQAQYFDAIVSAGHGGSCLMSQCTGVPLKKIYPLGMPRTDRYIGKVKGDGHTESIRILKQPWPRIYLYAPTFRQADETPLPMVDWHWLDKQLTDDEILVVKYHPYSYDPRLQGYRHIVGADRMTPSVDYLYDCDVLITDYSSIMFDAYLLDKPVVLFEKNKGYLQTRGMYLNYPWQYSSRYATNEQELLELIRTAKGVDYTGQKCIDYLAISCDGHSCERIIKLIEKMKG